METSHRRWLHCFAAIAIVISFLIGILGVGSAFVIDNIKIPLHPTLLDLGLYLKSIYLYLQILIGLGFFGFLLLLIKEEREKLEIENDRNIGTVLAIGLGVTGALLVGATYPQAGAALAALTIVLLLLRQVEQNT